MFFSEKESKYPRDDFRSCNFHGFWAKHFINAYVDSLFKSGIETTQEAFSELKREHLPKSLYKFYTPSTFSIVNLHNRSIYLASPKNFNDPFDSYVGIEKDTYTKLFILKKLRDLNLISKEISNETFSEEEYWKIFYSWSKSDDNPPYSSLTRNKTFFSTFFEIKNKKSEQLKDIILRLEIQAHNECNERIDYLRNLEFRISSFSNFKDDDDLMQNSTMWSHYSMNHFGFCVKYNLNFENVKYKDLILCGLYPINYTSRVPKISPRELLKLKTVDNELVLNNSILKTTFKALITKSAFWNYEKEWRLIVASHNAEALTNSSIQFSEIESIFLGCRIDPSLKKHLVQFAENNNITIFQTKQSNEKYMLHYYQIDLKSIKEQEFYDQYKVLGRIKDEHERLIKDKKLYDNYISNT